MRRGGGRKGENEVLYEKRKEKRKLLETLVDIMESTLKCSLQTKK